MTSAVGHELTMRDLAALESESWIDPQTAAAFGLRRVDSLEGAELVGRDPRENYSGIVFPVYWPGDSHPREYFLRRDHPPIDSGKPKKYLAPPGRKNLLLFGPAEPSDALTNPSIPILLTEGLKKLCAAWRLARHNAEHPRFLACAISGVWNFRGTIGKTFDASGTRIDLKGVIPDIDRISWVGRPVFIIYDSDAAGNPAVASARDALADELRTRGARVTAVFLPHLDAAPKTGLDDFLSAQGPERALCLLAEAQMCGLEVQDDPEPIPLDTVELPEFPLDILPIPWFREMVEAVSSATETPPELALGLGLAVLATAAQRRAVVQVELGYDEPLSLFVIVALDSGNRKTAVLKEMTAPLLSFEGRRAAELAGQIATAEAARRLAEDRIRHLRQRAAKAVGHDFDFLREELLREELALPDVPKPPRLWAQDVTIEKLGLLMADHGERMAILSDEGGVFDILAGRYSQGVPNLDLFLQGHAGTPYRVDRGSRPSIYLENPALTLGLSPQPAVLKGLVAQPSFRGRGLLARLLIFIPQSKLGYRTLTAAPVAEAVRARYAEHVHGLLSAFSPQGGPPKRLALAPAAHAEWKAFQRHIEVDLREGGTFEHLRDWASKLPGAVARIAGVLHCAAHADGTPELHPINTSCMNAALTIGAILERHALAAFDLMGATHSHELAKKVWRWIVRQRRSIFSQRDLFQAMKSSCPAMEGLAPALHILVDRGYLFEVPKAPHVGRPSRIFRLNSRLARRLNNA